MVGSGHHTERTGHHRLEKCLYIFVGSHCGTGYKSKPDLGGQGEHNSKNDG